MFAPATWPCPSASAPPGLPGFSATSVWITLSIRADRSAGRQGAAECRDSPAVTEPGTRVDADRDHELTHAQDLGVPELAGTAVPFRPEDGGSDSRRGRRPRTAAHGRR